jgi:hypothetical protein
MRLGGSSSVVGTNDIVRCPPEESTESAIVVICKIDQMTSDRYDHRMLPPLSGSTNTNFAKSDWSACPHVPMLFLFSQDETDRTSHPHHSHQRDQPHQLAPFLKVQYLLSHPLHQTKISLPATQKRSQ